MQKKKYKEIKGIFVVLALFFLVFLVIPVIGLLIKSFLTDGSTGVSLSNYIEVLGGKGFMKAVGNSLLISSCSALLTTVIAFFLAYTIH